MSCGNNRSNAVGRLGLDDRLGKKSRVGNLRRTSDYDDKINITVIRNDGAIVCKCVKVESGCLITYAVNKLAVTEYPRSTVIFVECQRKRFYIFITFEVSDISGTVQLRVLDKILLITVLVKSVNLIVRIVIIEPTAPCVAYGDV